MANVKDLLVNGSARVIGTIYGNATSANKVNHSLTFGSKSFNGSSAQTITLADLGGKPTQSAVSSPSASGTAISFIDTISQNANGVITATKKTVRDASASQSGVVSTGAQIFAGAKTFIDNTRIQLATPNLYITDTSTGIDTYSIIRMGSTNASGTTNPNAAYIFLNGPQRINDGGANLMTIRNNVGDLRLNNDVINTGRLTIGQATKNTSYTLTVNGTSYQTDIARFIKTGTAAIFGGIVDNISSAIYAPTTGIQLCAGAGGETNSTAIGFHNPGISSSILEYKNFTNHYGAFRMLSDDSRYWFLVGGTNMQQGTTWSKGTTAIGPDGTNKAIIGYLANNTGGVVYGAHNSDFNAWAPVNLSGSTINFREGESLRGKILDGCLSLFPSNSNFREGIRIHSNGSWSDILLCGDDNTGDSGTSTNSWFLGNNNGNFYITRNGSGTSTHSYLASISNNWTIYGGSVLYNSNDATLQLYTATNTTYGNESIAIQTCFDGQTPSTSGYTSSYEHRCNLLLQPRGGQVYIGTNLNTIGNTSYSLYVTGSQYIQTSSANSTNNGIVVNNGLLSITNYSNTLTIGSSNSSWAHFESSKPFWFSNSVQINGNLLPYIDGTQLTGTRTLGDSTHRWKSLYVGTANSYGSSTVPVYWNNGVPTAITSYSGNASTATKLATTRTIQTNLASTASASFDGSANITPGVTGILPTANGGTGQNDLSKVSVGNADKVDNYHVNDHGYVYKYTREVICTTTLKDWYVKLTFGSYTDWESFELRSYYNNRWTWARITNTGFTKGLQIITSNQNGNTLSAVCYDSHYLNGRTVLYFRFHAIQDATTSHYSPSTQGNCLIYSNNRDFTLEILGDAPTLSSGSSWTNVPDGGITYTGGSVHANLSGNASTATKLQTARTISLTGSIIGSGTFDGSGNLSISTTINHNHDSNYVKKSGDTMNGSLHSSIGDRKLSNATAPAHFIGNLHFYATNGSGGAITDGNVNAITFGDSPTTAYAGIYSPSSGSYGNYLMFATTDSYSAGAKTRMIIDHTGKVGIGTTLPSYLLHVNGDTYANGWSRTGSGFYCEGTGVHFTHNGNVGEIDITNNNEFLWGSGNSDLYFNHRAVSRGTTVTNYIWNAGSSTSWASHNMGSLTLNNGKFFFKSGDGTLKMYSVDGKTGCGDETIAIQSCFDNQDPETHGYVTSWPARCVIALQPRGGAVNIGDAPNHGYKFYVNGSSYFNGNTTHNGIDYFANGTTYYIDNSGDTNLRRGVFSGTSNADTAASNFFTTGALEIRESGRVGTAQSSFNFAPRIGFHWYGRIAATLSFHSDGIFYFRKQNGSDRATIDANLNGNASTATKLATARTISLTGSVTGSGTFDGSGNLSITTTTNHNHDSNYVKKSGDTMTGNLTAPTFIGNLSGNASTASNLSGVETVLSTGAEASAITVKSMNNGGLNAGNNFSSFRSGIDFQWYDSHWRIGNIRSSSTPSDGFGFGFNDGSNGWGLKAKIGTDGSFSATKVYGAVWNDYAEYRKSDVTEPGRVVIENGDGTLSLSTKRLQRGAEVISDTFGFAIGETDECKTPIAATGRVLAYTYEPIEEYRSKTGWPVCSGPNGTVSIMTEEEEEKYPSRIIGTISEVPDYEEWGTGKVKTNGRVWIRIK